MDGVGSSTTASGAVVLGGVGSALAAGAGVVVLAENVDGLGGGGGAGVDEAVLAGAGCAPPT